MLDVVVFTCEGRENLLQRTWQSFSPSLANVPHRLVLAIDGQVSADVVRCIQPDVLVQNYRRRGYIHSILNALALVESEYFLWLEDDWEILGKVNIEVAQTALSNHPNWIQVRWSKEAPLASQDVWLIPGIRSSSAGFSANPAMCRTALVREGFSHLLSVPRGSSLGVDGFENVLTRWVVDKGWVCAVFDPGDTPAIGHLGELESTGREWHMTQSLATVPQGHGFIGEHPPFWRRVWMIYKLARAFIALSIGQLFSDAHYELAFRVAVVKRKMAKDTEHIERHSG